MVGPVNSSALNSLLRTQQAATVSPKPNQQIAPAGANRSPKAAQPVNAILLASAKSPPPPNLPRGSIVDKLV
jgi:hypothetical protein